MEEALRLTTEYLTQPQAIRCHADKFQTLTQRAADMYVSLELARSMSLYAAMSLADGDCRPGGRRPGQAADRPLRRHIGQEAIQMHGGIGDDRRVPGRALRGAARPPSSTPSARPTTSCACWRTVTDYEMVNVSR